MRLWINGTSPYARLCRVVAAEKNLSLELRWTDPWSDPDDLLAVAPAAKIPVLELDDETALTESAVIADMLDRLGGAPSLAPASNRAMARLGLARALTDCAFAAVAQRRFHPNGEPPLTTRWLGAARRMLAALEAEPPPIKPEAPGGAPDLADLTLGVALSYLKLRHGGAPIGPRLAAFAATMAARRSFVETDWTT